MLVKDTIVSRNVQVSCALLELSGRQLVVFQVKVFQISFIRQLIYDVAESFTIWISAQIRGFFVIAHVRFLMHLSVADGSRQTGGPLVVRNSTGTLLSAADSRFNGSSLVAGCTQGLASSTSSFNNGSTAWTNTMFIILIFVQFTCVSWICGILLRQSKS